MKKIFSLLVIFTFLFSCGESVKKEISNNQAFASFISGYTSGVISKKSSIRVKLTESIGEEFDLAKEMENEVFSFSPSIKGKTIWVDNRTLEFVPETNLKAGTEYIVNFNLKTFKKVSEDLEQFVFKFKTISQNFEVSLNGLMTPSAENRSVQEIDGVITFADEVDSNSVQKGFSVSQNGKNLPVACFELSRQEYRFVVGKINRHLTKDSELKITFNGESVGVSKDYEKIVSVFSQKSFKITEAKVIQFPQQYINIHFSDPIKPTQNLNGLITLSNGSNLQFIIDGHDIKAYPNKQIEGTKELTVYEGVKNKEGFKLGKKYTKELTFEALKPDVRQYGEGVIIPSDGKMNFPFEAVNLKAVDIVLTKIYESNLLQFFQVNNLNGGDQLKRVGQKVLTKTIDLKKTGVDLNQWNKFTIDLSSVINKDKASLYQIHIRFKKEYSNYPCEGANDEKKLSEIEIKSTDKEWSESDWSSYDYDYYGDYDYYDYDYNYSERKNPCYSMYYRNKGFTKNILMSDIGLIAKAGTDNVLHVFVNDINTTKPMSGIKLDVYNFQQKIIGTILTDGEGMASIELDEKPFVVVASDGNQRGYIRLRDGESLSLSKFDVSGTTIQKGIKGFLYTERGVWRPGDSIYLSFMMEDKDKVLPQNHPVEFVLYNPKDQLVTRKVRTTSVNGIYDFRTATTQDALTGNYRAQIKIGNRSFVRYLKVETVKPNRLKVKLETEKNILSKKDNTSIDLTAMWLHGSPASKLRAKVDVSIDQSGTGFDKFKGYYFDDPTKRFYANDYTVYDSRLDENGQTSFPLKINISSASPGMLNAHFTTKIFEEGGGFSINRKSLRYSPYTSYAGVKVPKGQLYSGTLETNKTHTIDLANVSENGKPLSSTMEVKIYKIEWRYWWDRYDSDLSSYISRSSVRPILSKTVRTRKGKSSIDFKPTKWGRYLVVVKDKNSGHSTGQIFYADERYWGRSNDTDKEFMTMLAFSTDKETYETEEEVKYSFPSLAGGRALISVENGSKIIEKHWIKTTDKETKGSFKITKEMTPNVFVHITMLQPHKNTLDEVPLRMYGIVPISIQNKDSHLEPVISMPDVLRPETTTTIKVKEKNGKKMSYTLAIVDEGLLDLTNFKTPNPYQTFYAREALGVKSWDVYDYVLNAFKLEKDKILAVGGGGEINPDKKNAKANRFKPMVRFIGPFELPKGTNTHQIKIPNYVGSVRVMVVAGENLRYGNAEKTVPVRNPLMVLGTLPRVVGPKEDITLPVDVFAMEKHVKNVKLSVFVNEFFELESNNTTVNFEKTGDKVVRFKMKTANKLGIGKVKIVATSGKEKSTYEIELDVRPANPPVSDVQETVVESGKSWDAAMAFKGIKGTNEVTLEVSSFPAINLEKRMDYLIQYPHGCVEQTTSSVFPQLFLGNFIELNSSRKIEIENNVKAGIERLLKFQTSSGGFSYWAGESNESEWGSNYASHFLIEAEKKGYTLPFGMKKKFLSYLKNKARVWRHRNINDSYYRYQSSELIQSYRLYILALAGSPELGAMNRMKERLNLTIASKWRLAGAYQLSGQEKIAKSVIFNAKTEIEEYTELSYSYGSNRRDESMILEVLSMMKEKGTAASVAKRIATSLGSNRWMSTQTTSYSLIGMSKFLDNNSTSKLMKFNYKIGSGKSKSISSDKTIYLDNRKENSVKMEGLNFTNTGKGILYVRLVTKGIPVESNTFEKDNNLKMTVYYQDMAGNKIDPSKIIQGTDFKMKVSIYNPGIKGHLQEMALSQIFPSGWEIHNARMGNSSITYNNSNSSYDYQDIRDDRVYTYFSLRNGRTKTFTLNLNATYEGKYYLPSILCEAMYDNSISSVKPGKWVEVIRN